MRPTKKERNGMTFHADDTVSFFNQITGEWERSPSARRWDVVKEVRAIKKAGGKLYADEQEKLREKFAA